MAPNKKLDNSQFIADCIKKHGKTYNYDKTQYSGKDKQVIITCKRHGDFLQFANNHRLKGMGCPRCGKEQSALRSKNMANAAAESFIAKAQAIHENKYNYHSTCYQNSKTVVTISCPTHGEFTQLPTCHLRGMGCLLCKRKDDAKRGRNMANLAASLFTDKARAVHGDKYQYHLVDYVDNKTPVTIVCPEHGEFKQKPSSHIHLKRGCARCRSSHGENAIARWLQDHNIPYVREARIPAFNGRKPFDFHLTETNTYIEYDGEFRFRPIFGHVRLLTQQKRDNIRDEWCKQHDVNLIVLYPNDLANLDQALKFCLQRL